MSPSDPTTSPDASTRPPTTPTPSQPPTPSAHDPAGPPARRPEGPAEPQERLGRYRLVRHLGSGGFGAVFLGYDEELRRPVAVKVPHRERVATPDDVELYLREARVL